MWKQRTSTVADSAKRRELKIKQYQKEKELRGRIEVRALLAYALLRLPVANRTCRRSANDVTKRLKHQNQAQTLGSLHRFCPTQIHHHKSMKMTSRRKTSFGRPLSRF